MPLLDRLIDKLQRHPKRIVFPEGADPRILQAARTFATRRLGVPILLGDRSEIKDRAARLDVRLEGIRIIDPREFDDFDLLVAHLQGLSRFAAWSEATIRSTLLDPNYFATALLATARADALCGGATVSASSALRPLFQIIPLQEGVRTASSMLLLDMDDPKFGEQGVLFMADCGVIPEPSAEQLADIALTTAGIARHLTGAVPRVAFLSFSTHARNPKHESIIRLREAMELARERARCRGLAVELEGELQVDAALDPLTARQKGLEDGTVAGRANVLVFPDLASGNIASKLVTLIAGVRAYGQIITGLTRPCAEISRGAHAHDILGAAAVVCAQAIDRSLLYPES